MIDEFKNIDGFSKEKSINPILMRPSFELYLKAMKLHKFTRKQIIGSWKMNKQKLKSGILSIYKVGKQFQFSVKEKHNEQPLEKAGI